MLLASCFIFVVLLKNCVNGSPTQCTVTDVKSLLEGCDRLQGMNVTSVGGTIVNDHNCDVLLPKQVFTEEPFFRYDLADSVCYIFIITAFCLFYALTEYT